MQIDRWRSVSGPVSVLIDDSQRSRRHGGSHAQQDMAYVGMLGRLAVQRGQVHHDFSYLVWI